MHALRTAARVVGHCSPNEYSSAGQGISGRSPSRETRLLPCRNRAALDDVHRPRLESAEMEAMLDQPELFTTIEQKIRKRSFLRQFIEASEEHGVLVPRSMIASALEISTQRVHQLVQAGRLAELVIEGRHYVPAASLELFLTEERKTGVHLKVPGWRVGPLAVRGMFEKRS